MCSTDDDCTGTILKQTCFSWDTFFGDIRLDEDGINIAKSLLHIQFDNETKANIIGPEWLDVCNFDYITGTTGCPLLYPAKWDWTLVISFFN